MNYVMCEFNLEISYFSDYTIGTYGCEFSSKPVALRSLIKHSYGVGTVLITIKPHNNIDDGSTTFKVIGYSNMISNDKEFYC